VSSPDARDEQSSSRLAEQRTDLAWNRSGLAILACGLLVTRGLSVQNLERSDVAVGGVILGLGIFSYLLAGWQARRRHRGDRGETAARAIDLAPLAIGVAVIGLAAFVLGTLFPA
jgi:uncharacterized membrane protein YidH (DUF202 family)